MVRGHHWWKKTTQHLKIDGHAHLQGQLLSYKRLDGAPPPLRSFNLLGWGDFLHWKRCYLLFVFVDFDWKFWPFLLLHHGSEVWQSLSFADNSLVWKRGLPRQTALDLDFDLPQIAVVGGQSVGKSLGINDEDADFVVFRKSAHEATKDRGGWLVGWNCVCVSFRVLLGRSGSWWIWGSPMVSFNAERLFSARNSQTHVTLYNGNACHI